MNQAKAKFMLEVRLRNEEKELGDKLRRFRDADEQFVAGYEGRLSTRTRGEPRVQFLVPHNYPLQPPRILLPEALLPEGSNRPNVQPHPNVHDGKVCSGLVENLHRPHMGLMHWITWLERLLDGQIEDVEPCGHLPVLAVSAQAVSAQAVRETFGHES
jgi:hypothetical protein